MKPKNYTEKLMKTFCQVQKSTVSTTTDLDQRILNDAIKTQEKTKKQPAINQPNTWRIVMQSSTIKYAAAAIIIGILVAVSFLGVAPDGAQFAWAKVAEKVEKINTAIYQMKLITKDDDISNVINATCYYSKEYGSRKDLTEKTGTTILYYSSADNTSTLLLPEKKLGVRLILPDEDWEKRVTRGDPRVLFNKLMGCEYQEIGVTEINGITVKEIEFIPPADLLKEGRGRLWVEVGTDLPVCLVMEGSILKELSPYQIEFNDFRWNAELGDDIFPLVIPPDYTVGDDIIIQEKNPDK